MAANDCQRQRRWMLMLTRASQWTLGSRTGWTSCKSRFSFQLSTWPCEHALASQPLFTSIFIYPVVSSWQFFTHSDCWSERRLDQYFFTGGLQLSILSHAGHIEDQNFVPSLLPMAQKPETSPAKKCQGATFTVGGYSYKIGEFGYCVEIYFVF